MDDEILEILKRREKSGRRAISIAALAEATDKSERAIRKRIEALERYGLIEKKIERKTSFWGFR